MKTFSHRKDYRNRICMYFHRILHSILLVVCSKGGEFNNEQEC
ncbi:hypothetical protein ACYCS5_01110 [Paenibacillus sp. SEL3]